MILLLLKFLLTSVFFVVTTSGHASVSPAVRVDGPTYPVPTDTSISVSNIQLSADEIKELSNETKTLKTNEGGFKPLKTKLTLCAEGYSKTVDIEHLAHPFFVVGDDEASYQWIAAYKPILQKLDAVGLVIQADNVAALDRLHHASGLPINPAQGDNLATFFNMTCYPVLITAHRIEH